MSTDDKKSFYLVTGMSAEYRKFDEYVALICSKPDEPKKTEMMLRLWELRIQLATAQQLTNISESLKKLVEKMTAV